MAAEDYQLAEVDLLQMNDLFDEALEGPATDLVGELRDCLPKESSYGFACFMSSNFERIVQQTLSEPLLPELVVYAYRVGITAGFSGCTNDLGCRYYMGDLVPRDYERAAELYDVLPQAPGGGHRGPAACS